MFALHFYSLKSNRVEDDVIQSGRFGCGSIRLADANGSEDERSKGSQRSAADRQLLSVPYRGTASSVRAETARDLCSWRSWSHRVGRKTDTAHSFERCDKKYYMQVDGVLFNYRCVPRSARRFGGRQRRRRSSRLDRLSSRQD